MLQNLILVITFGSLAFMIPAGIALWYFQKRPTSKDVVYRTLFVALALLPLLAFVMPRPVTISMQEPVEPIVIPQIVPVHQTPNFTAEKESSKRNPIFVQHELPLPETQPISFQPELPRLPEVAKQAVVIPKMEKSNEKAVESKPVSTVTKIPHWSVVLCVFWLLGMIPGTFLLLHSLFTYRKILRETEPLSESRWLAEIAQLESRLGLRQKVAYKISDEIDVPQVVGVFRPTVLLSRKLLAEPPNRAILIHELSHVQRQDVFWQLFSSVVCLLYWYQPLIWFFAAGLRSVREEICDNQVLRLGEDGADYATTLLDMSSLVQRGYGLSGKTPRRIGCAVTPQETKSHLERRILWLLDPNRKREPMSTKTKIFTVTTMLALALAAVVLCPALENENLKKEKPKNEQKIETKTPLKNKTQNDDETICCTVVDEENNEPAPGVKIFMFGKNDDETFEIVTDENGRFSFVERKDRPWTQIYVVDTKRKRTGVSSWGWYNTRIEKDQEAIIKLQKDARTITGTVVDANGKPVENIPVFGAFSTLNSVPVLTDKDGRFEFLYTKKQPLLNVVAFRRGVGLDICPTQEFDPYETGKFREVTPPEKLDDGPFELKLAPIEPVKIRIVNEEGEPLPKATLMPWLIHARGKVRTGNRFNASGTPGFTEEADENGVVTLHSVPKSFLSETKFTAHGSEKGMEMPDGKKRYYGDARKHWKDMEIRDGMPIMVLPRAGVAKLTVRLEDGTPVPDVGIKMRMHNGGAGWRQTDKNGESLIRSNLSMIYNLSFVSDKGAAPALFNYTVGDGNEEKRTNIVLKPGVKFHGKVFMPDGSPAEDFSVSIYEKDPNPPAIYQETIDEAIRNGTGVVVPKMDGSQYHYDTADRSIYARKRTDKNAPDGEFETIIPATERKFYFSARKSRGPDNPKELVAWIDNVRVPNTEKELKIHFHLSEDEKGRCVVSPPEPVTEIPDQAESIEGRVVDKDDHPRSGVKVFMFGKDGGKNIETVTDENGRFSIPKPENRDRGYIYALDTKEKLGGDAYWGINTQTGKIKEVTIKVLKSERVITGTVVDANDRPMKNVYVFGVFRTIQSVPVLTDKDGQFEFLYWKEYPLMKVVAYQRGVGLDILPTQEIDPYRPEDGVVVTPPEKLTDGPFRLKLTPIEPAKIQVVNEENQPLAGAIVGPWLIQKPTELPKPDTVMWGSAYSKERQRNQFNTSGMFGFDAITDENGVAVIESVPKSFIPETTFNFYGPPKGVEMPDGKKRYYGSATHQWKGMDIRNEMRFVVLPRQGSAKIKVRLEDGTPVPGVNISVRWHTGSHGYQKTDENGESLLKDNVNVLYNLSFESDKGAAPALFNFSVGDGNEIKQTEVVLKPGIKFYGKVFMPDGSPAEDFYLSVDEKDPNPPASYQPNNTDWEARRTGTVYSTDTADSHVSPRKQTDKDAPAGEFETLLPAVAREYCFRVRKYPDANTPKEISARIDNVRLLGTEKELHLDFHLGEDGQGSCTPHALTPVTQTTEKAKPLGEGKNVPRLLPKEKAMIPDGATIKIVDENDQPLSGVEIAIQYKDEKWENAKITTDENGVASLQQFQGNTKLDNFFCSVTHKGYVYRRFEWNNRSPFPWKWTITLKKGVTVGGIIVDENNQPIEDATVNCGYDAPDRKHWNYSAGTAKTDAEGKWSVDMAPPDIRKFRLDVTHPDYMPSELTGTFPPYIQMKEQTAVVMLRKGGTLRGVVLDPDGKPVAGAKVVVTEKGQEFGSQNPIKTEEDGTFLFKNWSNGPTRLFVAYPGFAPQTQDLDFDRSKETPPVELKLIPGKTVTFKILDTDGKPIPKARVCPFRWRGTFRLLGDRELIPQHADEEEGNWQWTWAPDDEVEYSIICDGYMSIRDLQLKAQDEPHIYRMHRPLEIIGTVTDADTGNVIPKFTLTLGGNFDGKDPKAVSYWNSNNATIITDGVYRAKYTEPRPGGGHHFMIEADGYEPFVSEMFTDEQGSLELDVKLRPKK